MRRLTVLAAALGLTPVLDAQAATAGPPQGVAAAFGNTVKALYSDGKAQRIWFRPDGTWEAVSRRGKVTAGRWSLREDRKVCLKQSRPFPAPFKYCTDFPRDGGLGVVWTSQDWQGEPIRLTVVKGIERPQGVGN